MAPPRRLSGSKDHPPPKKRRVTEPETVQPAVALDPNAIDHSLDLVPPSHFDSFSLDLFEEELNVATDAVMPSLVDGGEAAAPPVEAQDDDADADADEDTQESGKTKTKKKAKRRHSGQQQEQSTPPKMPPAQQPVMDIEEIKNKYGRKRLERIRRQAIKDAWKEYQEETSRVVQQLPEEITSMFGQIGYGKFGKKYFPVLLICPFGTCARK